MSRPSCTQATKITTGCHVEDTDLTIMSRVVGRDGTNITQDSISGIVAEVWNLNTLVQQGSDITLVVADTVFDQLQRDSLWDNHDYVGYNFKCVIDASYFPDGDQEYRIEIKFTPVSGNPFRVLCSVSTENLLSS